MKIILIHYRYYDASGPETYLFNVTKMLTDKGHEVIPFSLDYAKNKKSDYSKYFPKPVIENFHFNKEGSAISLKNKISIIKNGFYNKNVYHKLQDLIDNVDADAAYVLQYGARLSTSIFDVLSINKIPVLLRLSDFNLICAKNIFYRNGNVCTKCITNKFNSVVHKCVHDSLLQSFTYYAIQMFNDTRHFERKIDAYIVPSLFTYELLTSVKQFENSSVYHIPTFSTKLPVENSSSVPVYDLKFGLRLCYIGRIAEDKGVDLLIDAMLLLVSKGLDVSLDLYGDYNSEYAIIEKKRVESLNIDSICFKGYVASDHINRIYRKYHFCVIPSRCYDNMPNSLIESCANGIPVIASKIGSLDKLILDGFNGYKFESDSISSLARVIELLYSIDRNEYKSLSNNAVSWVKEHCDIGNHYDRLMSVFKKVIDEKSS